MSVPDTYEALAGSAQEGTPVLRAVGVVKRFGDNVVLRGLDLDVASHEVVVLIGASGSGKSTLRMIIVPQAIRKVTPALMNDFISMQKDVGLISVLGAVDAIRSAQMVQAKTYNMTSYVVAGLLFIILSFPFIRLSDWYTARLRKREQMGGTV